MKKINLLVLTSFALILIVTSMAFASAHQMNHNMQGRNSNFMSMHRANNYIRMSQQNSFMHNSISSLGNSRMSRMNFQQNAYMYMPNHRHMNNYMHKF